MKIAVIGSGISGLGCALLLQQNHEVTLFEASDRLGGHAHTSSIQLNGDQLNVDTGFLVYNKLTYPHLTALFEYLNVETVASDMSLSIQNLEADIEWAGDSLKTVFAQKKNLFRPAFYRLLINILRFHREAELNCERARQNRWTVAQLLKDRHFSKELTEWYVLPMIAAIWSTPERKMLDFPAETFLRFFLNHKLLQVKDRPIWRTVKNGSVHYVQKIAHRLKNIKLNEPVLSVENKGQQIEVTSSNGSFLFDKVIFATHAPLTRKILKSGTDEQYKVLDAIKTEKNRAQLHSDESFMPKQKICWASWNTRSRLHSEVSQDVDLTYYLNRLQPLQTKQNLFLTLNSHSLIQNPVFETEYQHPVFDQKAIDAQKKINDIQGLGHVYFAGAWTRYGFHEDGLLSAVQVAEFFNLSPPWKIAK